MAISRYDDRELLLNDEMMYKNVFRKRGLKFLTHYDTAVFQRIHAGDYSNIETIQQAWKIGDRFSKLAEFYYHDPSLWWIIARFNEKPTESHVELGELVFIPVPLEAIFDLYGV